MLGDEGNRCRGEGIGGGSQWRWNVRGKSGIERGRATWNASGSQGGGYCSIYREVGRFECDHESKNGGVGEGGVGGRWEVIDMQ